MENQERETKIVFRQIGFSLFTMAFVVIFVQGIMQTVINIVTPEFIYNPWYIWMLTGISFYLVGFPIFMVMMKNLPNGTKGEPKKMSLKDIMILFVICMAAAYLFNIVGSIINILIGMIKGSGVMNPIGEAVEGASIISTAIFAGILSPIIEEVVFRGIMLDKLRDYGDQTAIWVTALMFGLFHGNLSQFFYAFVLGLFFGYVAIKTNRIRYSIVLHIMVNMLGAVIMPGLVLSENPLLTSIGGFAVIILFIGGLILYIKNIKQVTLEPGDIKIDPTTRFKTIYGNVGMLLYYAICLVMFVSVILI